MRTELIVVGAFITLISGLHLLFPRFFLSFGRWWMYKDATPTDTAVTVMRTIAVITLSIGIVMIFGGIFADKIHSLVYTSDDVPEIVIYQ